MNIVAKFAAAAAVAALAVSPVAASAATKHHAHTAKHVKGKHMAKESEGDAAVARLNEQSLQQARTANTPAPAAPAEAPAQPQ
ncbi:ribosomal protein L12E/L44/L45/RPP1/RPP2 [Endobacter medicaginis]|uniref:Ribosomal protein L12E/L44/L45/RPP1/RPP2 n=1 Tax=Endobacter medicaginis TaxID=1181271 RepID=A0A850NK94_9PROT|nr:hypothetical protein [Endobacter medicaginis]MBB3172720.1 ribosomal protein L12E/L44/L45/RPP1/RPP2 [Endobacter medicaginis]MCX5474327.1 hypothetical protein [Endobacter medicaginis]NVN30043.1 hypothetical protein [Endobacter medicaginis]